MLQTFLRLTLLLCLSVFVHSSSLEEESCLCADVSNYIYEDPPEGFSSEMEVAGCFCEHEGKVLYLLRNAEKPQGNTWCLPGGKLEKGESPREAVIREVKEETGLELSAESLSFCRKLFVRFPNSEFTLHLFRSSFTALPEKLELAQKEHSNYRWVTYEEALQLPLINGGKECLQLALQRIQIDE